MKKEFREKLEKRTERGKVRQVKRPNSAREEEENLDESRQRKEDRRGRGENCPSRSKVRPTNCRKTQKYTTAEETVDGRLVQNLKSITNRAL